MSFSGPDTITVQSVGEATEALFKMGAGSSIGLRGPLGNGFILRGESILLIGGGVGTAPLAFLGEQAKEAGIRVTSLAGFRSREDIILQDRLEALGDLIITTDDGSAGIKGRVAEGLKELDLTKFSQIYLCGPEVMMWDIISRTREHAGKTQACLTSLLQVRSGRVRLLLPGPGRHKGLRGGAGDHGGSSAGERVWQVSARPDRRQGPLQGIKPARISGKTEF